MDGGTAPGRPPRPARGDHGAGRPQDDHQRAELGRQRLHGGFRRLELAHLGERGRGAAPPERRRGREHPLRPARLRQGLRTGATGGDADGAAARMAPAREARPARRPSGAGLALRFRPLLLPQRAPAPRARHRAVLLPSQDAEPPRSAPLERRLPARAGGAGHRPRHDQGHRAHRDAARRLRDGRDPLRAARALGGAQLRALGLHLQHDQDAARRSRVRDARPRAGHDGAAVPARLHAAPRQDLPPARRPRDGGHGRADPDQGRSRGQPRRPRQGPGRQAPRGW